MRTGRPLRFLVAVLGGWVGLRALVLWPSPEGGLVIPGVIGPAAAKRLPVTLSAGPVLRSKLGKPPKVTVSAPGTHVPAALPTVGDPVIAAKLQGASQLARLEVASSGNVVTAEVAAVQTIVPPPPAIKPQSRWSGSIWAIARPDGAPGGLGSSQLGGAQAGARLAYALDPARRVAVVGRVATPLEGKGREAALGVEWRPGGAPVRLFIEQRFALDRGSRGGPSAGVIAGAYEQLPGGLRLEAYGQAGVIERGGLERFADGAARLTRDVGETGAVKLDIGVGGWGGAQRGAERLDVGPTIGASVRVGGRRVRLTLDYRARIAGRARPGSGPALSLGTDF